MLSSSGSSTSSTDFSGFLPRNCHHFAIALTAVVTHKNVGFTKFYSMVLLQSFVYSILLFLFCIRVVSVFHTTIT